MDILFGAAAWGTPLGLGLFFFFSGIGAGMFFWGISRLAAGKKADDEA